jgi:hypothetical protein
VGECPLLALTDLQDALLILRKNKDIAVSLGKYVPADDFEIATALEYMGDFTGARDILTAVAKKYPRYQICIDPPEKGDDENRFTNDHSRDQCVGDHDRLLNDKLRQTH